MSQEVSSTKYAMVFATEFILLKDFCFPAVPGSSAYNRFFSYLSKCLKGELESFGPTPEGAQKSSQHPNLWRLIVT